MNASVSYTGPALSPEDQLLRSAGSRTHLIQAVKEGERGKEKERKGKMKMNGHWTLGKLIKATRELAVDAHLLWK